MSHDKRTYTPPPPSLILPPHTHKPVDFTHPLKDSQHSINDLTQKLNQILNLKASKGDRHLTTEQKSTLQEYQSKSGVFKNLLDETYPEDDKTYIYCHLFNVLILQDKLRGRLDIEFRTEINEQRCAETEIEEGYATIIIWSQEFITCAERRLRQLQHIALVEMLNAFFKIYGCKRCWRDYPDWQEEGLYGKNELDCIIQAAVEDDAYLALKRFP